METIKEDYVSFEVAKLLKEKGFNIPCRSNYRSAYPNNISPFYHNGPKDFNGREYTNLNSEWYSAPTLQMAMKWLREAHKLYCDIKIGDGDFVIDIISLKDGEFGCEVAEPESCVYSTYEEACEAAIKYCLENLI